ncbi:MAG TPA: polyprenyl diphosphate synthase, partial [Candidatus Limnocylindria bacterium]|nr:polyprenyl diphosphate synthase [Candidatus Limnocylindria bacterium]
MTSVTATDPGLTAAGAGLLPRHVAIVMDGNRRWARLHGLSEGEGHSAGVDAIRPIVEHCADLGIQALSIYAFSRENWARNEDEVQTLFALLEAAIRRETPDLVKQGVRVRILGRLEELPDQTRASVADALADTSGGHRMTLNVAFNYSGRSEIVDAVRRAVADGLKPEEVDEEQIRSRLYTADGPDLDLLIRTGGEQRISNFLIWQAAYAEFYFCEVLWPDFGPEAFDAALGE